MMDPRYKALLVQAIKEVDPEDLDTAKERTLQRFAELIVADCEAAFQRSNEMAFNAKMAQAMTHEARVKLTVDANIKAVKDAAASGSRFTYAAAPFKNDDQARREANDRLKALGFTTPPGYVQW